MPDQAQNSLYRDLGRMEAKIDSLIDLYRANAEHHEDYEKRIEALEAAKAWVLGAAAAAGAFSAFLFKYLLPTLYK